MFFMSSSHFLKSVTKIGISLILSEFRSGDGKFLNGWLNPFRSGSQQRRSEFHRCVSEASRFRSNRDFRLRAVNRSSCSNQTNAVFFLNQSAVKIGRECELTAERLVIEMLFQHGQPITRGPLDSAEPCNPLRSPKVKKREPVQEGNSRVLMSMLRKV